MLGGLARQCARGYLTTTTTTLRLGRQWYSSSSSRAGDLTRTITFVPPVHIETKQLKRSRMNYFSNVIFYDEKADQCNVLKNANGERPASTSDLSVVVPDTSIPMDFYGFPSVAVKSESEADGGKAVEIGVGGEMPMFYLGSLVTPFYVARLNRHHNLYYLVTVKDEEQKRHVDQVVIPRLMGESYQYRSEWVKCEKILSEFGKAEKMITPETRYMLEVLNSLSRENIKVTPEEDDRLGCNVSLQYAPNIESIPVRSNTLVPFNTTNLIISKNANTDILLIDPGANEDGLSHFKNIIELNLLPYLANNIEKSNIYVFITHNHQDHWEGIPMIEKYFPNAKLVAHPQTLDTVPTLLAKVPVLGKTLGEKVLEQHDPTNVIKVGDREFNIIATPGHTSDSLSLFEPVSKTLIAGDHIVGWGSTILDFQSGDMKEYIESTQNIIQYLQPKIALPAHGPSNHNPIILLQNYIKHRLARENEILKAYQEGNKTLTDILKVVYKDIDPKLARLAEGNIHLHLVKLKKDNKIPHGESNL